MGKSHRCPDCGALYPWKRVSGCTNGWHDQVARGQAESDLRERIETLANDQAEIENKHEREVAEFLVREEVMEAKIASAESEAAACREALDRLILSVREVLSKPIERELNMAETVVRQYTPGDPE